MIAELLVLYTCSQGFDGCAQSRHTYLTQNPEVKTVVERTAGKVGKILYADKYGIFIAAAYKKEINIPVNKNISVVLKDDVIQTKVVYAINF